MSENKNLPVLGTEEVFEPIKKSKLSIKQIKFVDTIPSLNEVQNKWDVSDAQNGSVMAWIDNDTLEISGNGVILANEDCINLFCDFESVEMIEFHDLLDTSKLKYAYGMFWGCQSLESLDVSKWNTQNLEYTDGMFEECWNLKKINLSNWNVGKLKNESNMFAGCENLKTVITTDEKIKDNIFKEIENNILLMKKDIQ